MKHEKWKMRFALEKRPLIIVMAKAPRPGEVKTRLVPPLSQASAASLASCFLRDTVANAQRIVKDVLVAYAPADGRQTIESILPKKLLWLEQRGEDLGKRITATIAQAQPNYSPLIVIGSDSPTMPVSFIRSAIESLVSNESDVVLGPTDDGGYYLVALRELLPSLFEEVEWSTPLTYSHTARNAALLNLRTLNLPQWYDVDTLDDLLRLRAELLSSESARLNAPATLEWFNTEHLKPANNL